MQPTLIPNCLPNQSICAFLSVVASGCCARTDAEHVSPEMEHCRAAVTSEAVRLGTVSAFLLSGAFYVS
jgi:hypothetical protein